MTAVPPTDAAATHAPTTVPPLLAIEPPGDLRALQRYIDALEHKMGWAGEDLRTCLLHMGEELGEVYEAARKLESAQAAGDGARAAARRAQLGHELVDVLNYLLAVANRCDVDLQRAFLEKNNHNQGRVWAER